MTRREAGRRRIIEVTEWNLGHLLESQASTPVKRLSCPSPDTVQSTSDGDPNDHSPERAVGEVAERRRIRGCGR